eukprot:2992761-Pleurochrysis_carterae.AAC.3
MWLQPSMIIESVRRQRGNDIRNSLAPRRQAKEPVLHRTALATRTRADAGALSSGVPFIDSLSDLDRK